MSDEANNTLWTRRSGLTRLAWTFVFTGIGGSTVACVRALFPRARATRPSRVVLGRPDEFQMGEVSERWKKSHGLILVRDSRGFFALRSVCTHLGCVPGWQPAQSKFKCFCHGSGFKPDGTHFEGPAPRPLERLAISLDESGRIVVDTAHRFRAERGEWTKEGAFLPYEGTS